MVTQLQQNRPHRIKLEFSDEPVASFGGLVVPDRMAERLRLWSTLGGMLPKRGGYPWLTVVKAMAMGLLSGAQGTYATEPLRHEAALLKLLSLSGAPEEATVCRLLEGLGGHQRNVDHLPAAQAIAARRALEKMARPDLMLEGLFVPVFADGTLLEGSRRREGTKYLRDKGAGLMWSTVFVGPALAAQRLAGEGEGEQSCVRAMLPEVARRVLKPLGLARRALVLADSLHGDGPTLDLLEGPSVHLHYLIGANKLKATDATLADQPEVAWRDTGAQPWRGWSASGVCQCWLQCPDWPKKRLLVGRRFKGEGEMLWNHAGVLTDLTERDVAPLMQGRQRSFAETIWRLYDAKGGMETLLADGLSDLGLHHPPSRKLISNEGFYAVASLAWLLATAVDRIGGRGEDRGGALRQDGQPLKRPKPQRMRLWRLRRELFALPARVRSHARTMTVQLLGLDQARRDWVERYWGCVARC
jgi:hypothetical protein